MIFNTEAETGDFARRLAGYLHPVDCLTLEGTLGAGKTTLMRHLIHALSGQKDIPVLSPSFTIVQEYEFEASIIPLPQAGEGVNRFFKLYHLDGYRLNHPSEIAELGLEEMLESGIVAIEWPEIFAPYLPENRLEIKINMLANQQRQLILEGRGHHANTATQLNQEYPSREPQA
jgi:tRNA A37 threonylcarbamoyladenosine biosynthesis protein TsaE